MYDLYCEFDINKHKEQYINYLEIIILPTGKVEYAVPSHQEKLISIGMSKYGCSREELDSMCPRDMWSDFLVWLCDITGCIAVWTRHFEGEPNRFQRIKLEELKRNG